MTQKDIQKRFIDHKRKTNKHLRNAFKKYNENIVIELIAEESKEFCLLLEEELRPNKNIGWNIAIGGGLPPPSTAESNAKMAETLRGKKQSPEVVAKRIATRRTNGTLSGYKIPTHNRKKGWKHKPKTAEQKEVLSRIGKETAAKGWATRRANLLKAENNK